jgi:hypothetical protein
MPIPFDAKVHVGHIFSTFFNINETWKYILQIDTILLGMHEQGFKYDQFQCSLVILSIILVNLILVLLNNLITK